MKQTKDQNKFELDVFCYNCNTPAFHISAKPGKWTFGIPKYSIKKEVDNEGRFFTKYLLIPNSEDFPRLTFNAKISKNGRILTLDEMVEILNGIRKGKTELIQRINPYFLPEGDNESDWDFYYASLYCPECKRVYCDSCWQRDYSDDTMACPVQHEKLES